MTALSGLLKNLLKALPALLLLGNCVLYAADGDNTNGSGSPNSGSGNNDNSGNESGQPVPASDAVLPDTAEAPAATEDPQSPEDQNQTAVKQLPRVVPNPDASRHYGLLQYLQLHSRESELVRLVAAESEFYGLLLTETRGQPQGGVLILHDNGQHGHWPEIVAPLRETLPAYGWTTLSIELPEQPVAQPPARTSTAEYTAAATPAATEVPAANPADNAAAPSEASPPAATPAADSVDSNGISAVEKTSSDGQDSAFNAAEPALPRLSGLPPLPTADEPQTAAPAEKTDPNERYREQMQDRIRQGISFLNQRGQLNIVVIACGNSANWAADFLLARSKNGATSKTAGNAGSQSKAQERGLALILIDALDNPLSPVPLNQQLVRLDLPLLDLISEQSISPVYVTQQRAGSMRHKQRLQYQQIEIPAFDLNYDDSNLIVRRVRGWLKTNAAGTELPNQKITAN